MRQHATLKLVGQQNVPFYAFSFDGTFQGHEATLTVLRTNDGIARIVGTPLDEDSRTKTHCAEQTWVFSALALEGDCEFLSRLPKGLLLDVSWTTEKCSEKEVEGMNVRFAIDRQVLERLGLLD